MGSGDNSRQNEARIFKIRQKLSEQEQKTALSLYFRADFRPPFSRELSHDFEFLLKIKIRQVQLDWR